MTTLIMNMGPHYTAKAWFICEFSWEMFLTVREPEVLLGKPMADQLATAFDVDAQLFLNLHDSWRKCEIAARKGVSA